MTTREGIAWFFAGITVALFATALVIQYGKKDSDDEQKKE